MVRTPEIKCYPICWSGGYGAGSIKDWIKGLPSISFQFNNKVFENNDNIAILGLDIIDEYMRILNKTLGANRHLNTDCLLSCQLVIRLHLEN